MGSSWTKNKLQHRRVQRIRSLRIRAFRAIDDIETSKRFAEGHEGVLKNHGITKVSSTDNRWMEDPNVYVLVMTSPSGHKLYGGARIHLYSEEQPLPSQVVLRRYDENTDAYYEKLAEEGCAEFCALWNSVEIAGLGIGAKTLVKCGWSMCAKLGIRYMVALLSPLTKRWMKDLALERIEELGNGGQIPYPDDRLIATITKYTHPEGLDILKDEFRQQVEDLQEKPQQDLPSTGIKGTITVHFDLLK